MAVALHFNGSNQYAKMYSDGGSLTVMNFLHTSTSRNDFEYEFNVAAATGSQIRLLGYSVNYSSYLLLKEDIFQFRMGASSATTISIDVNTVFDGTLRTYKLQRIGNNFYVRENDVIVGSTVSTISGGGTFIDVLGRMSTGSYSDPFYLANFIARDAVDGNTLFEISGDVSDTSSTRIQNVDNTYFAIGQNMPTDGSAWIDLGSSGTEQPITLVITQQLTQSETVEVIGIGFANAIISESIIQSQLVNINETAQLNAIVSEQKTQSSLQAIATINNVSHVVCEQITESSTVSSEATQLVYAVQAQQLTQSLTLNIASDGTQDVNASVTEQKSHSQIITLEEVASIKAVICEQLAQAVNANVSAINETNAIIAEQLSQSITVSVDESSGIFVSVVHTEQLSQSTLADINADSIVNAIITQQLTQTSTQHINVDITLDAVICDQLTHAELITIIEQNISQQLNIDIDQITIEILTPTYTIEHL